MTPARDTAPIRIVLCHAQVLYREGLRLLLEDNGFDVASVAADAADLRRKVGAHRPSLVLIDAASGEATELRRQLPELAIIVLAARLDGRAVESLLETGSAGLGCMLESSVDDVAQFSQVVRQVAAGGIVLDPRIVAALVRPDPLRQLSAREREVLEHVARGRSNRGVAQRLFVSEHAVEKHVRNILAKLNIPAGREHHRRVMAALTAVSTTT